MSEHVETLRELLSENESRGSDAMACGSTSRVGLAMRRGAALTAAIEALEWREWKAAPDGDGLYWAHCSDRPTAMVVRGDEAAPLAGSLVHPEFLRWSTIADLRREAKRRGKPLLWSRLPDPPPVPESEGE